jgi:hypothetical protein
MLKNSEKLVESFQEVIKESNEKCGDTLELIRSLIYDSSGCFAVGFKKAGLKKCQNSLVFWWYMESVRISGHILYLTKCGLYRNAFDDIRHLLESIIQASYVETNHTDCDLRTKLEILKEIEDKKEYHARRLIEEKRIIGDVKCEGVDCKGLLKKEYVDLSNMIHPSHEKFIATMEDVQKNQGIPAVVNPEEVVRVLDSLRKTYDICFFTVLASFPEINATLVEKTKIRECVSKYELPLLGRILTSIKVD